MMTIGVAKNIETQVFYSITLHYYRIGDMFLLTIKNSNEKRFICIKQVIPRNFALIGVPIANYDDPSDIMRILKVRIQDKIRQEAHLIKELGNDKIDHSFFSKDDLSSTEAANQTVHNNNGGVLKVNFTDGQQQSPPKGTNLRSQIRTN